MDGEVNMIQRVTDVIHKKMMSFPGLCDAMHNGLMARICKLPALHTMQANNIFCWKHRNCYWHINFASFLQ